MFLSLCFIGSSVNAEGVECGCAVSFWTLLMGRKEVSYSIVCVQRGDVHDIPSVEEDAKHFRGRVGGWKRTD